MRNPFQGRCSVTVARLVLDGVLEIEGDEGFVSGYAAQSLLFEEGTRVADPAPTNLTVAEMKYAQGEGELDPTGIENFRNP